MKKIKFIIFALLICISNMLWSTNSGTLKTSLSGKITDKETKEALTGATLYIPDLKTGAVSDIDGNYKIDNLPQRKVLIQINFIGYKTIIETIDLSVTTVKDFELESSVKEMKEVVVTGLSQAGEMHRTPTPIAIVSKTQLLQNTSTNIIDAIATQPGVSQVTTGSGISKPVIRGLGYNRVVVVNDGTRQEGQQWGDEHGIEIDEFAVNKVEILKGPASLSYGSDAMAGVVNMISSPTLPDWKINGNILTNYQTNNGLMGYSCNVAGNLKGLIWDLRYSNKMAHAYQNKYDGYVLNSGFKENNLSGIIGLNKSWGYSHLHFSVYDLSPGIVEGERDSTTGEFVKPYAVNDSTQGKEIATNKDFKSYTPLTPFQKIHHFKAVLNNNFLIGSGNLKTIFGFQQNQRKEFGEVLQANNYGLYFLLNTINYDLRYILPEHNNFNISFGINGMQQNSENKGTEFLIPEYSLFDIGAFTIVKKSFDKLDISGGIRFDSRSEHAKDLYLNAKNEKLKEPEPGAIHQFTAFNSVFTALSGSAGVTYQFSEDIFSKLNISRGFRAPSIGEAGANGVHDGTNRYEIGNPDLNPETSLQLDYALGFNTKHITAEMDLFSNSINNFIFSHKLNATGGGDSLSQGFSTFKFVPGNAHLMGGEIMIDAHPHPFDWLHFENSFSYVQAIQSKQPDSTKYLPFTPAAKLSSELRADIKKSKNLRNAYIKLGIDNYFTQDKFYSAFGSETKTPGYMLVNLGVGTDFTHKDKTICSLFISVSNLTDVAYQNHLSRLKYEAFNYATGRTGVYNMGRNISMKLMIPLNF